MSAPTSHPASSLPHCHQDLLLLLLPLLLLLLHPPYVSASWGSDLQQRLKLLPQLPSQDDSINGICVDVLGSSPVQICALESGKVKAVSLLDGQQVSCIYPVCCSGWQCDGEAHFIVLPPVVS